MIVEDLKADTFDAEAIKRELQKIIPEVNPQI
jgi:hypothetical protein